MRLAALFLFLIPIFATANNSCDPQDMAEASVLVEVCEQQPEHCIHLINHQNRTEDNTVSIRFTYDSGSTAVNQSLPLIYPNQMVRYQVGNSAPQFNRYFGGIYTIDSDNMGSLRPRFENINLFRDSDLMIKAQAGVDVRDLRPVDPLRDAFALQKSLLQRANVTVGTQVVIDGIEYVTSEVQGEMLDRTGQYIYLRAGEQVRRVPVSQFYASIIDRVPSSFVAFARSIARGSGRVAQSLRAGPLAAVLEVTLSPTMAACATLDTMFIRNICSRDPQRFHDWFKELDIGDRRELLNDPTYCQIIQNRVQQLLRELQQNRQIARNRLNQVWNPQNLRCSENSHAEFTMDFNLLPAPGQPLSPSTTTYYRYVIDQHCPNPRGRCHDRISVETWNRNLNRPIADTQQIVLTHRISRALLIANDSQPELTPGARVVPHTTISHRDPKLEEMITRTALLCRARRDAQRAEETLTEEATGGEAPVTN